MMDKLEYAAEVLRFIAVPAAVFELVHEEKRRRIEEWLFYRLKSLLKRMMILLLGLYVAEVLLVTLGPYLVLFWLFIGNRMVNFLLFATGKPGGAGHVPFVLAQGAVVLVAAIFVAAAPRDWIIAVAYPFEYVSAWITAHPVLDPALPDFSARAFLENFDRVFNGIRDWLWDWLAWINGLYFFFAKGFSLVLILLIELAFVAVVVLGCFLVPGTVAHLFIMFSDLVKSRFGVEHSGRIPVGAAVLLAIGETLGFTLETIKFFK